MKSFLVLLSPLVLFGETLAAASATAPATAPVYDIPRVDHINVDGNPTDWGDRGFRVDILSGLNGAFRDAAAFDPRFRMAWDNRGLLFLVTVRDAYASEADNPGSIYDGDCVELFIAPKVGSPDDIQFLISPGIDPAHPEPRTKLVDTRVTESLKRVPAHPTVARTKIDGGYLLQALLPWDMLAIDPKIGQTAAVQVQVDDMGTGGFYTAGWFPGMAGGDSDHMETIRLSDSPSPPVDFAAVAEYEQLRHVTVTVVAAHQTIGKQVDVREASADPESKPLASTPLAPAQLPDGIYPTTTILLPMPPIGNTCPPLTVSVDGRPINTLTMPDLRRLRHDALIKEKLIIPKRIFSGKVLPIPEFARPSEAEEEIGRYTLSTTYYDSKFHPVKLAAASGRYGAITEIKNASGEVVDRRNSALFCSPSEVTWYGLDLHASMTLPKELGIPGSIAGDQLQTIDDTLQETFVDSIPMEQDTAVLLAGLSELKPNQVGEQYDSLWRKNDQWWHDLNKSIGQLKPYEKIVHLPGDYQKQPNKKWPLILFLHGSGDRGDNLDMVRQQALCAYAEGHPELPFVVVSPQCPFHEHWSAAMLSDLLDEVIAKYSIDADHIYVTGLSMGGFGTWTVAAATPECFAAVIPIAGAGDPADAIKLRELPMWVFHCDGDPIVPIGADDRSVKAVQAAGGNIKYTVFHIVAHDAWTKAYEDPALYQWMLSQSRRQPAR